MTYENLATKYAEDHGIIDYTEKKWNYYILCKLSTVLKFTKTYL